MECETLAREMAGIRVRITQAARVRQETRGLSPAVVPRSRPAVLQRGTRQLLFGLALLPAAIAGLGYTNRA